ncbi:type IV secretion system protein DotC [Piscirickettsia salmonis]|uniref:Defect in organelle trafficking protein DotC n=1 Tax=Piscirickettsia salmonis TaxID=1238 RepID=A0A095CFH8_PISSA|nr:type IV secretory system conjugative DNA transfer family protein [Piscirickettsia salmonis]AKP73677.1 type IV secretion system protein DotC [Piscirickettsia salmonis LF-89 = ATCC VR-1361]ALA25303.1 type IV secretion system protein DotC [Piscirickettsia salmonis]ALB22465.1 type IV secretion system protein DotC [Piscirickettsia salmonis]AMA42048.1 type IV secretion system protein DotC [Piscirickettsia salmonis]AOS34516.1 type IV secretion system protein DotC [Piscirickettsia salmonis]
MIDHALYSLEQLSNLNASNQSAYYQQQEQHLTIRLRAVKETALSLGAQAGLAAEAKIIDSFLVSYSDKLDKIFNFNQLLLQSNVLPPVISDSSNSVNVEQGAQSIRVAGRSYKIISQVRFVTAPPTWRDYLYLNYSKPELPNKILLPQNTEEETLWKESVTQGWQQGIRQAVTIYKINLNRLVRDYTGMVLYKKLLTEGLVSPVYVAKKYQGVTGDKNKVTIDDWTWAIKDKPGLQIKSQLWQPVVGKKP